MTPWSTDTPRSGGRRFVQLQSMALGLAMFSAAYLFSLNRNVLYLSLLASSYVVLSTFFTRYPPMLASLGVFGFLAMFPAQVPRATFVDPVEKRENFNGNYSYVAPPTSGAWQYEFEVVGLERPRRECGGPLRGNLVIDGIGLEGLILDAGGRSIATASPNSSPYGAQQLLVPLEEKTDGKFLVTLQRKPESSAGINIGTEVHKSKIYSDAVWVEFRNERCAVLYHARRRVLAAFPPPR